MFTCVPQVPPHCYVINTNSSFTFPVQASPLSSQCRRAAPLLKGQTARRCSCMDDTHPTSHSCVQWAAVPDSYRSLIKGPLPSPLQNSFKSGRKDQQPKSVAARGRRGTGPWTLTIIHLCSLDKTPMPKCLFLGPEWAPLQPPYSCATERVVGGLQPGLCWGWTNR